MSLTTDAVKKASQEKEKNGLSGEYPPKNGGRGFFTALVAVLAVAAAGAALYFYQESRLAVISSDFQRAQTSLMALKERTDALTAEKTALQEELDDREQKEKIKIDELSGNARVLRIEKETLEADNAQKEKIIADLKDQIQKQDEKEAGLMALIQEAKQELAKAAVVSSAKPADSVPAAGEVLMPPVASETPPAGTATQDPAAQDASGYSSGVQ